MPVVTDQPGGTVYNTEKKTFEGYTFLKMADDSAAANGVTVNDQTLEVTYVYAPNGSVQVRHVTLSDEGKVDKVLKDWETVQENKPGGTPYITSREMFDGYKFVGMKDDSDPARGVVISGKTIYVTYVYDTNVIPPETGNVKVRYITKDGGVLEDWSFIQENKPEGTLYSTVQKEFDGYTFKEVPDYSAETSGSVKAGETLEVTYVYEPAGSVKVRYITKDGSVLDDWRYVQENKPDGTAYTTAQRDFPGYAFVEIPEYSSPAAGSVRTGETLEVTYVYQPVGSVKVHYITKDGDILEDWTFVQENAAEGTSYITEQKEFKGYEFMEVPAYSAAVSGSVKAFDILEITYVYRPARKSVEFSKIDFVTRAELPGVTLSILDATGTNILRTWTTVMDDSGNVKTNFVPLEPGEYILREDKAPEGYVPADDVRFTVTNDEIAQKVEMVNTSSSVMGYFGFDLTIDKKWVDHAGNDRGWPEGVDKITVKLQYLDKTKGWTDLITENGPVMLDITKGMKGTFSEIPANIDGEKATYRVVEMTNVNGYSTVLLAENGLPVSSTAKLDKSDFDMELTNKEIPPENNPKNDPKKDRQDPPATPQEPGSQTGTKPVPDTAHTPTSGQTRTLRMNTTPSSVPGTVRRVVTPSGTTVSKAVSTGDSNGMILWIVLAVIAAASAAGAAVVVYRRRRE